MEKASSTRINLLKSLYIVSFLLFTVSIVLIWVNSPATGYEISVFRAFPLTVWLCLSFAVVMGICLIVYAVLTDSLWNWYFGAILLLLFNTTILSLQFMRGYFIYAISDPFFHVGTAGEILTTGYFTNNIYPAVHLHGATISMVTGLPVIQGMIILPLFFTLLFMIFTYYLTQCVSLDQRCAALSLAVATPLLFAYFHLTPYPHALAIFLFPLLFFIYFRNLNTPSRGGSILLFVFLVMFVFIHPLIVVVMITSLFAAEVAKWIWYRQMPSSRNPISGNAALFALCSFFLWFAYFTGSGIPARQISQRVSQETVTTIRRVQELDPVFQLDLPHFIELTIKMYGHLAIYLICAAVACCLAFLYLKRKEGRQRNVFLFSIIFVTSMLSYMVMANQTGLVTMGRLFSANAGIWATPVLVSVILLVLIRPEKNGKARGRSSGAIIVVLLLVLSCFIGVMSSYRSPWIYQQSWQVTHMDMAGTAWVGEHSVEGRFGYEPMGFGGRYRNPNFPRHFGYARNPYAGDSLYLDTYVILTSRFTEANKDPALQYYLNVPWYLGRQGFNTSDFARFRNDPSVDEIYRNREFSVFLARSTGAIR
ncbi:MAG: hypothetical protein LUQ33_02375 [Methanoregulaceae archaeon]|nr:hypothetical protein [Methanoregulaceae archaeon]